eukprot:15451017-Alexandrium_andersonii.AAC.1
MAPWPLHHCETEEGRLCKFQRRWNPRPPRSAGKPRRSKARRTKPVRSPPAGPSSTARPGSGPPPKQQRRIPAT